jgi:gluconate 2-dehydrogenase alpha chain
MAIQKRVDIVTVGAGWTAGIIAQQLTEVGLRIVSLEQGPSRWATPDFAHNHDGLRYAVRTAMMVNLADQTWTWRPNPRAPSLPLRHYGSFHPGQGIGGAGIHWAAQHWRFQPADFRYRSHHLERYGEDKIPAGALIQDWPLTYDELEPFYDRVDYDIGVSGQAGNIRGEIQPGGNPFEGPRARPYPLPPLARSIVSEMFAKTTAEMGYHPFPQPTAILSQAYTDISGRTRAGCLYCGYCVRYGCEVDAKASANVSHIPLALRTGQTAGSRGCILAQMDWPPGSPIPTSRPARSTSSRPTLSFSQPTRLRMCGSCCSHAAGGTPMGSGTTGGWLGSATPTSF